MNPVILYRDTDNSDSEYESAKDYFTVTKTRMSLKKDDLVIGRYSVLPFYELQEYDINYVGAKLINSYKQHNYIADLLNYVNDLKDLTPQTWTTLHDLPDNCSFVLKGKTNSKKHDWKNSMFAENKKAAIEIYSSLCDDSLIGTQDIYIRKFIPLKTYFKGIKGLPITKEFRFFVCYGQIVCGAYYWSNYVDDLPEVPDINEVPKEFLNKAISIVGDNANFYVLDVAQTDSGEWIVIELNDGQMSGLSCNDPNVLYKNLKNIVDERMFKI